MFGEVNAIARDRPRSSGEDVTPVTITKATRQIRAMIGGRASEPLRYDATVRGVSEALRAAEGETA